MQGQVQGADFPRAARLLVPRQFQRVFKQGRRSRDALFMVIACRRATTPANAGSSRLPGTEATDGARLGLAVSKKVSKHAVTRNRIKRQVREAFRQRRAQLAEQGFADLDIVVIANPAAAHSDGKRLRQSLEQHWQRIIKRLADDQGRTE